MRNPPHLLAKFSTITPDRWEVILFPFAQPSNLTFDVHLEVEEVDVLPVGAVQAEDVPGLADLGRAAERHHVQVGEDSEEQLPGQLSVDQSLVVLGEDPGDLPLGEASVDGVTISVPGFVSLQFSDGSSHDIFTSGGQPPVSWPSARVHLSPNRSYISPFYGVWKEPESGNQARSLFDKENTIQMWFTFRKWLSITFCWKV